MNKFCVACENNNLEYIEKNITSLNINLSNKYGHFPLFVACYANYNGKEEKKTNTKIIKLLIENGADVNLQKKDKLRRDLDFEGYSSLHIACYEGKIHIVKLLIKNGSSIESINTLGETPIMIACLRKCYDCIKFLCEKGANLYAINKRDENLLHYTSSCVSPYDSYGYFNVVKFLIGITSDKLLYNKNNNYKTPIELWLDNEHYNPEVGKILEYVDQFIINL